MDGWKWTIHGYDREGHPFYVAGKILQGHECEYFFVITAHAREVG